jgi:hypothetical protein
LPCFLKAFEEEKAKEAPNENMIFEFEAIIPFIQEHFQTTFTALHELPEGHIDFDTIWVLFPYHSLVCSPDSLGQPRAYRVKGSGYGETREGTPYFSVQADYIDSDGNVFGYVEKRLLPPITGFSGSMPIHDLSVFPLNMSPSTLDGVYGQILELANKTIALKGRHLREYQGHGLTQDGDKAKKFNVSHYPL